MDSPSIFSNLEQKIFKSKQNIGHDFIPLLVQMCSEVPDQSNYSTKMQDEKYNFINSPESCDSESTKAASFCQACIAARCHNIRVVLFIM